MTIATINVSIGTAYEVAFGEYPIHLGALDPVDRDRLAEILEWVRIAVAGDHDDTPRMIAFRRAMANYIDTFGPEG